MTTATWLALGTGIACAPAPGARRDHLIALARIGRLACAGPPRVRVLVPARVRGFAVAGICMAGGAVLIVGGVLLAAAVAVTLASLSAVVRQATKQRAEQMQARLHADAIGLVVAELRAGSRPEQALRAAAEIDPGAGWRRAADAIATDRDPAEMLLGADGLDGVGHAWRVAAQAGAPFADVLERIADDHTARLEQRRAVQASLAGAHASATVLAVLPVLGIALGAAMGLHPLPTLLHTTSGHLLCCLGAAFDAAGVLWTARIVAGGFRT